MNAPRIAVITECRYKNSYPSQYGDENGQLHAYTYAFDDGVEGEASHKAAPPWGVGDEVEYTIVGEHRGRNKLKVRLPQAGGPPPRAQNRAPARSAVPARTNAAPARGNASASPGAAFLGVTVGMAVNNACQLALEEWKADDSAQVDSTYWRRVWDHASQILRVAQVLEKGKLAPNPRDNEGTADPEPEPEREPQAPPPRQVSRPGPGGAAFDPNEVDDDQDVPF